MVSDNDLIILRNIALHLKGEAARRGLTPSQAQCCSLSADDVISMVEEIQKARGPKGA